MSHPLQPTQTSESENIAGFAGLDAAMKWAESTGDLCADEAKTRVVIAGLIREVWELRRVRESQAAMIRKLEMTVDEYQDMDDGRWDWS